MIAVKTRAVSIALACRTFEYIEFVYNRQHRHSGVGYKTPKQAFKDMTWKMAA